VSQSFCFVHIALYAFTNKDKHVIHKLLNRQIAARAKGVWHGSFAPVLRRSQIVCPDPESTTCFHFPFKTEAAILREWLKTGVINQLVGFKNNHENTKGDIFNFILSNGARSVQKTGRKQTGYTFMIPAGALKRIRAVTIHHARYIDGFSFFDKRGALLWQVGYTRSRRWQTVLLEENEVIAGVVAKLWKDGKRGYTDF
jgi:hypothetical protein